MSPVLMQDSKTGKAILPQIASEPHATYLFRAKLDARTSELVSSLLSDLSDASLRKTGVVGTTSWLLRLGQGEHARETFLTARGQLLRKRARQIKFEGDISMYISELAMVCFTLIKNTCEWYMAAFKDNRMASGMSLTLYFTLEIDVDAPEYVDRFRAVGECASRNLRRDLPKTSLRCGPRSKGD